MIHKNKEYRKKNLRGKKIDDLYIFLEILKKSQDKKTIETIQSYIQSEMDYEPVRKEIANG